METHQPPGSPDHRPPLHLRVAYAGHRNPANDRFDDIKAVLQAIADALADRARTSEIKTLYQPGKPKLTIIGGLAAGADLTFAAATDEVKAANRDVCQIERCTLLPFDLATDRSAAEADSVAAGSRVEALYDSSTGVMAFCHPDGESSDAHAAHAQALRRLADLVLVLWDGKPGAGKGGTGDTVAHARAVGIPVLHIPVRRQSSSETGLDDGQIRFVDSARPWRIDLTNGIYQTLRFDAGRAPTSHRLPVLSRLIHLALVRRHEPSSAEHLRLLARDEAPPKMWLQSLYPWVLRRFPVKPSPMLSRFSTTVSDAGQRTTAVDAEFRRLDTIATAAGTCVRSAFLMGAFVAAIALILAAVSLAWPKYCTNHSGSCTITKGGPIVLIACIELLLIAFVCFIVGLYKRGNWMIKWLDYRRISECLRTASLLARCGHSLAFQSLTSAGARTSNRMWVYWWIRAWLRASAPLSDRIIFDQEETKARKSEIQAILLDQISYHHRNRCRMRALSHALETWSERLIFATLAALVIKIFAPYKMLPYFLTDAASALVGVLVIALPAAAAAAFTIRAQVDPNILADRSQRMEDRLTQLLCELAPAATIGEIGAIAQRAAHVMLHDTGDWFDIAATKSLEVG